LEIEKLNRVNSIAQLGGIIAGTVHPHAKVLNSRLTDRSQGETGVFLYVSFRHKFRWDCPRMRLELLGDRFEPGLLSGP
jgi:predicted nucleotidyltransferase